MEQVKKKNIKAHVLMCLLVTCWGFDYVAAKTSLVIMTPMTLLFCKYIQGFAVMLIIKLAQRNKNLVRLKDIPFFIACSLVGEILYFNCEYNAMDYMAIPIVTIMLSLIPVVSILVEWALFKKKPVMGMIIGIIICIMGVVLVIGVDFRTLMSGTMIGYLFCIGAVLSMNVYNFITSSLQKYDAVTLTFTQMICTLCMITPVAVHNFPSFSEFTPAIWGSVIWLGVMNSGFGFLVMVYGLKELGPTISAVYSNFMPVTSAFFSFMILHEVIAPLQVLGGVIVVASGFYVIREKDKLDRIT